MLTHNVVDFVADKIIIAYISRGLLSALTEAQRVLFVIANDNNQLNNRVIINTYAIIDGQFKFIFLHLSLLYFLTII